MRSSKSSCVLVYIACSIQTLSSIFHTSRAKGHAAQPQHRQQQNQIPKIILPCSPLLSNPKQACLSSPLPHKPPSLFSLSRVRSQVDNLTVKPNLISTKNFAARIPKPSVVIVIPLAMPKHLVSSLWMGRLKYLYCVVFCQPRFFVALL